MTAVVGAPAVYQVYRRGARLGALLGKDNEGAN
jgi:hypothetical protein